jgi:hypothetical protein
MFKKKEEAPNPVVHCGEFSARMGWRYITYIAGDSAIHFQIEPMAKLADIVYVPDEAGWQKSAPDWAKEHREAVVGCLRGVRWNRKLQWKDSPGASIVCSAADQIRIVPGSLESTEGGKWMDSLCLFNPGQQLPPEDVRDLWLEAVRSYTEQVKGRVTIYESTVVPGSVFQEVELPILRRLPNITLDFK